LVQLLKSMMASMCAPTCSFRAGFPDTSVLTMVRGSSPRPRRIGSPLSARALSYISPGGS